MIGFIIEKNDAIIEVSGDVGDWVELFKVNTIQVDFTSNYKISKKIGSGIAATVYHVINKINKLNYAAKIFEKKKILLEETEIVAIHKELYYLRSLQHPNIIKFREVYENK